MGFVTRQAPPRTGLPQAPCRVGVVDFLQERFHNLSPDKFESPFITAGGSETQERLRVEEVIGEPRLCSALAT